MAKLGIGILIIPQKPWREVAKELDEYRGIYREVNGVDAPQPVAAGWTFVDKSADRAREMAMKYIGGYYQTVLDHYNFAGDHLAKTKGYEYYGKMAEKINQLGADKTIEYFTDLQVYGTPEQVYEKIMDIHKRVNNSSYVGVFSYAGMPHEEADRNLRLFAKEVMPELKKFDAGQPIDNSQMLKIGGRVELSGGRRPRRRKSPGGKSPGLFYCARLAKIRRSSGRTGGDTSSAGNDRCRCRKPA